MSIERDYVDEHRPIKRWDINPGPHRRTPSATIAYGKRCETGSRGIRFELASRMIPDPIITHKDRQVLSRHMAPAVAKEIGKALIEAADQSERLGTNVPLTSKSES